MEKLKNNKPKKKEKNDEIFLSFSMKSKVGVNLRPAKIKIHQISKANIVKILRISCKNCQNNN